MSKENIDIRGVMKYYMEITYFLVWSQKPLLPTQPCPSQRPPTQQPPPNLKKYRYLSRGHTHINIGFSTKFFCLSFPELWGQQHEK